MARQVAGSSPPETAMAHRIVERHRLKYRSTSSAFRRLVRLILPSCFARMKTPSILIYGAGGHAKVVADLARLCKIDIAGFIDDTNTNRDGQQFCGSKIYNDVERARYKSSDPDLGVIVAVGDCEARGRITAKLVKHNFNLLSLIHPAATIAQSAQISPGTVVMAGVIINADVLVGRNVIV